MINDLLLIFYNYFGQTFLTIPFFPLLMAFLAFLVGTFILLIPFLMIYALVRRWL